jgi:hypothetical protein
MDDFTTIENSNKNIKLIFALFIKQKSHLLSK